MNAKYKSFITNIIKSFFITFAWMNIGGLESTSILLICIFAGALILLQNKENILGETDKAASVASGILGAMFSVLYALFADLTGGLENRLFILVFVTFSIIGLFFMFSELLMVIITKAKKKSLNAEPNPFSLKILLIYSAIIFVCILPFLALNFPGVMTTDSLSQYGQIIGTEPWVDHHPWFHTALIGLFYKPAYALTGNVYFALGCYTIFQMLIVSFSIGYCIECMYEFGFGRNVRIGLLLCFVLLPYNLLYAITMWKDIIFSMAVVVLTVTLIRIWNTVSTRDMIIFIVSGFLTCLMRHNGYYTFIATSIIILIAKRKNIKKYLICVLTVMLLAVVFRGPVPKALGVGDNDYVYNVPFLLQPVGRVIAQDLPITTEEEALLRSVNSLEYIRAGFTNECADPMFAWVLTGDTEFFDTHKGDFYKLWLSLGLRYPMTYIHAYLDITMGYWAPMQPQQTIYFGITESDAGLYPQSIINGPVLIKINELIYKLYTMIPVYGFMYCMGGFFWILLVLAGICIARKTTFDSPKYICMLPVFLLTGTLFVATPLVADLRYSYALMITLPYILVEVFRKEDD